MASSRCPPHGRFVDPFETPIAICTGHLGRERKDHSMQPSSLVQEAFLRLLPGVDAGWRDRAHFFAVASQVMRHILVDYARQRRREKRGGGAVHIPVDTAIVLSADQVEEIVGIDLALQRLANRRTQERSLRDALFRRSECG